MEYLIPHYGSLKLVQKAVISIHHCDRRARILIGDDTRTLQRQDFKHAVEIIKGPQKGFATNVNRLVKHAGSEWITIMNNDVELSSDWLVVMQNALEHASDKTYCYASCLYRPNGQIDSFGDQYSWYGQGFNRYHLRTPNNSMYQKARVLGATGALMLVRRQVLVDLHGFSEALGSYCEDTAFHLQANNLGWQCYFVPGARAIHHGSATFALDKKLYLSARNSIMVARSCFGGRLRKHFLRSAHLYWQTKALLSRHYSLAIKRGIREGLSSPEFLVEQKITDWPVHLYLEGFWRSSFRLARQLIGNRILDRLWRTIDWRDIDKEPI